MCVAKLHKENWPPQTMAKGVMLERNGSCSSHLQLESEHGAVRLLAAGASVAAEAASASLKGLPGLGDRLDPSIPYAV